MDPQWLAKKLVNHTLGIGQKENPAIAKAEKRYGKGVRKMLRAKSLPPSPMLVELSKVDYGPLFVKSGKRYVPKPMVGHTVAIAFNPANRVVAEGVRRECLRNGAHTLMLERTTKALRESYLLPPMDTMHELSPINAAIHSTVDYYINLESVENEFWKGGISPAKVRATAPAAMKLHDIRDSRKQRWCLVGWPHPETAKELGVPLAKFRRVVNASIEESYSPRTKALVDGYYNALNGSKEIRIVHSDGTDLTFSVKGRRFLRDDGVMDAGDIANDDVGMNIPCGEAFTAPLEDSANGLLKIPKNIIHGYGLAEGIELFFEKGVVVDYGAAKHKDYLDKFFAENTGEAKRIAEFGIGCNSKAEFTNGYIIVDEKILGTIHVAIGWNIGYGGKNNASSHLDFIKPMRGGSFYADGVLVMDDGRLVA